MAVSENIEWLAPTAIHLDAQNPRLGRHLIDSHPSQPQILDWFTDEGILDELGISFLENGFWAQEAIVVVEEKIGGRKQLVAVEGNRRLAAMTLLWRAMDGKNVPDYWRNLVANAKPAQLKRLRAGVAFVRADTRKEVQAYLGFRHVTGIKEWNPAEKAEFIAHLIDDLEMSYDEVRRRIGSKTPTVRQNYIAYRLLLQMESSGKISVEHVEQRFSVLYLALRTNGVRVYLELDLEAEPSKARKPVPPSRSKHLQRFAIWMFGDAQHKPVLRDSRDIDRFGKILESENAVAYLERNAAPSFDAAYRIAGGVENEIISSIDLAADQVELALSVAHHHRDSRKVLEAVVRLGRDVQQLLRIFPDAEAKISSAGSR